MASHKSIIYSSISDKVGLKWRRQTFVTEKGHWISKCRTIFLGSLILLFHLAVTRNTKMLLYPHILLKDDHHWHKQTLIFCHEPPHTPHPLTKLWEAVTLFSDYFQEQS